MQSCRSSSIQVHRVQLAELENHSERYKALLSFKTGRGHSSFLVCTAVAEITGKMEQKQEKGDYAAQKQKRHKKKKTHLNSTAGGKGLHLRNGDI